MKKILLLSNLGWMLITTLVITHATKQPAKAVTSSIETPPPVCAADEIELMNATSFLKGLARYKEYQLKAINDKLSNGIMPGKFEDARSCWYSIEKLDEFICLIKQNATKYKWNELGIRFYYAAYPDTEHQTILLKAGTGTGGTLNEPVEVPVGMHHTLFMVPTHHADETNLEEDLFMQPRLREIPQSEKKEISGTINTSYMGNLYEIPTDKIPDSWPSRL